MQKKILNAIQSLWDKTTDLQKFYNNRKLFGASTSNLCISCFTEMMLDGACDVMLMPAYVSEDSLQFLINQTDIIKQNSPLLHPRLSLYIGMFNDIKTIHAPLLDSLEKHWEIKIANPQDTPDHSKIYFFNYANKPKLTLTGSGNLHSLCMPIPETLDSFDLRLTHACTVSKSEEIIYKDAWNSAISWKDFKKDYGHKIFVSKPSMTSTAMASFAISAPTQVITTNLQNWNNVGTPFLLTYFTDKHKKTGINSEHSTGRTNKAKTKNINRTISDNYIPVNNQLSLNQLPLRFNLIVEENSVYYVLEMKRSGGSQKIHNNQTTGKDLRANGDNLFFGTWLTHKIHNLLGLSVVTRLPLTMQIFNNKGIVPIFYLQEVISSQTSHHSTPPLRTFLMK